MPHLRFRGMSRATVKEVSQTLVSILAPLINSPEAHFVLEFIPAEFICAGRNVPGQPLIEVLWFARPQALQDQVAEVLTQALGPYLEQELSIIFTALERHHYYENGQHYGQ